MYVVTSHGDSQQLIGFMLVGGPALVFSGLRKLNEKRLLENTPRSKVRSAAMGVVELMGQAEPLKSPLISPLSQIPCCWWHFKIQELRSNGKSSSWVTIQELDSKSMFYLKDETGRVLVSPTGAEIDALERTEDYNPGLHSQLGSFFEGWGVNDGSWFGGVNRTRMIEEVIATQSPLFVLGELITQAEDPHAREARFRDYVESVKKDPARMAKADTNQDGTVQAEEWDAFRAALREEFNQAEALLEAQNPDENKMLIKAPAQGNFIIGTRSPEELESSLSWIAPLSMVAGIAASAVGAWLAYLAGWNIWIIVGCFGIGFLIGLFVKKFKGEFIWGS